MGQPHSKKDEIGVTLLNKEQLQRAIETGKLD
jgi:hypothetical protein